MQISGSAERVLAADEWAPSPSLELVFTTHIAPKLVPAMSVGAASVVTTSVGAASVVTRPIAAEPVAGADPDRHALSRIALAHWPRLDRAALLRAKGDPLKIARLVTRRTAMPVAAVLTILASRPR